MIIGMDDDTIAQVQMSTHYAPPRSYRAPRQDDYDPEYQYACRVAEMIVGLLRASGYDISLNPPPAP